MAKRNGNKREADSDEQIVRNSVDAGNGDPSEAIKTVAKSTELRLAYLDRDFKYVWVNPSYARGAGHDAQQLIGRNHFDLFPNEDHRVLLRKVIETGQRAALHDTPFELPSQPERGVTYWDVMAAPVRDAEDRVSGIVLTVVETTERKKMEEALQRSEGKYRGFVQNSPYGIILINSQGTVTEWNEGEERITGIPASAALGRPLWDIQYQLAPEEIRSPTFRQMAREKILSAVREGPNLTRVMEEHIQRSDGSRRIIQSIAFTMQYQGEIRAGGIVRDITEHKRAQEALKESEQKYAELANSIEDLFFAFDTDLRYTFWNRASETLTGVSAQDAIGRTIFDVFPDTEDTRRAVAVYRDVLMTQRPKSFINEYNLKGQRFFFEINVYPSRGGLTVFAKDITDRKRYETELNRLYEEEKELHHRLENELKKRMRFTHALVHELKTPLTPIVSSSEMLLRALNEDRLLRLAKNVYSGAIDLDHRVDELLELARIEVGMVALKLQPVDIRRLIRHTVRYMMPQALNKEQLISSHLPKSLPSIEADADRVQQILMNLTGNALRHTAPKSQIVVSAWRDGDNIMIEVQDNGQGIDEEMQKHLFEPYYQIERSPEHLGGLGLGLPIAKHIVELHGGRMWVRSAVGKGSTFGFSLPLSGGQR